MSQAEKTTAPQGAPSADAGLPMSPKWDPEKLAAEKAELRRLASLPLGPRSLGYVKRTGPGLLQSAMTLGAGSATASVLAGASFGYKLLWVQPLAMLLGVFMLGALSNVVLTRGERPYKSFGQQIWKPLVFLWAFGTVTASVIWHFPQYGLIAGAARDLAGAAGMTVAGEGGALTGAGYAVSFIAGALILAMNITVVFNYGKGATGVKIYERFLRTMIALVIFFFLLVCVLNVGNVNWIELFKGFIGYYGIPANPETGVVETKTYLQVLGMLGASVGINMTFLYPYSLLAKGWGPEHKTLARWDLGMTMFLPFVIVTSLIMVGMVATGVYTGADVVLDGMKPLEAAKAFHGIPFGNVIFCLGLIGMCGGAVSVHMVACGFTMCEMLGLDMTQKRFRLFALTPCVGVLGVVVTLPMWFPVFASAVCLTMLPIAYLIFFILNNKRSYIGDAVGKGGKRVFVNAMLTLALVFTTISAGISFKNAVIDKVFPKAQPAATETEATETAPEAAATETEATETAPEAAATETEATETAPEAAAE
ncbi:MAG: divalent metal cation transporter [Thermoguttaceae bacterium]|nr:divalent metal cation transporter [Thermoguttaceae bacterium]